MKTKVRKHIYYFILGMLGFAVASGSVSCTMYGSPYIDAKMSGKVTDKNNNPIEGIKVQAGYYSKQTFTKADGSYEISGEDNGYMTQFLLFTDIDGAENGGEFAEQRVKVEFTEADRTGKGNKKWYSGSFERKDINVEMEEVSVEE